MNATLRLRITTFLLCVSLLLFPKPAKADFITGGQVAAIAVGIAAIGAAIGVGVYFAVRRPPSITGCAATGPDGLSLQNESDQQTFNLIGDTAAIKPGDRIRVSGKKKKKDPSGHHSFLVEKLSKDYGPCKLPPATP